MRMIPTVIILLLGLTMGRERRPLWAPALLACLVAIATILFVLLRSEDAPTDEDDLSLTATVIFIFVAAYFSYAMGLFLQTRHDAESDAVHQDPLRPWRLPDRSSEPTSGGDHTEPSELPLRSWPGRRRRQP